MPPSSNSEATSSEKSKRLIEIDSLVTGGLLLVGGIGTAALQSVFAFKEKDLSGFEHGITSSSIFIGGAMSAAGVMIMKSGLRKPESEQ